MALRAGASGDQDAFGRATLSDTSIWPTCSNRRASHAPKAVELLIERNCASAAFMAGAVTARLADCGNVTRKPRGKPRKSGCQGRRRRHLSSC